ncbi:hypothetical protein BGX28_008886 [Mortierella sp. GBA30]|nr:hypothetical protein BGX28_008886 [Mortierella sp. GBA30]
MRYMIERGLYLAALLNRTLVLPTHLRIRHCSDIALCQKIATPLDLEVIGRNDQGSTLALDIGYFYDLPHLYARTKGAVIDFRTFMEDVVGTPYSAKLVDSQFGAQVSFWQDILRQQRQGYPTPLNNTKFIARNSDDSDDEDDLIDSEIDSHVSRDDRYLSINRIRRSRWDLEEREEYSFIEDLVRNVLVDNLEEPAQTKMNNASQGGEGSFKVRRTFYAFGDVRGGGLDRIVQWSLDFVHDPKQADAEWHKGIPLLDMDSCRPPDEDPFVDQIPWEARFPAFATCSIENYVGLKQELNIRDARILSIEGQFHTTGWMPLVYSSLESAQAYRSMALSFLQYTPAVYEAAEYLSSKLKTIIQSRQGAMVDIASMDQSNDIDKDNDSTWLQLSMHVRRGDFVTDRHGWQEFDEQWMRSVVKEAVEMVFGSNPLSTDKQEEPRIGFYMATDESSPEVLDYFSSLGAVLFEDLIDQTFEDRFDYLIAFDDWIGLVEQVICTRAKSFYGTMSSSFTSGIVNMRLGLGSQQHTPGSTKSEYLIKPGGPVLPSKQTQGFAYN